MSKVSVVINTLDEEKNLPRVITSVNDFADEVVVVDMNSEDKTAALAKSLGAKVYLHKKTGYVEPARNFAISKATGEWILILDADEVLSKELAKKLKQIVKNPTADYFRLPRKNIIFGTWIKHSRWWPDYNIRFFRKGKVVWNEIIHSVPVTGGKGADLPAKEDSAIVHYNYASIEDYLLRLNKYSSIQAETLISSGYKFIWKDLFLKPSNEFLNRYFAGEGYKDGVHGLALGLLQAFSEAVTFLKVWQAEKFLPQAITSDEVKKQLNQRIADLRWWLFETEIKNSSPLTGFCQKILRRIVLKK